MNTLTRIIVIGGAVLLAGLLIIQIVPYGHDHTNPPVVSEPNWDNPDTRAIAERACFDCHSNETQYPWYASVAPVSWLVVHDAQEGRQYLNFSEWGQSREQETEDIVNVIREGEMPPAQYVLLHPEAKLTSDEQQALIQGLSNTIAQSSNGVSTGAGSDDDGDDD